MRNLIVPSILACVSFPMAMPVLAWRISNPGSPVNTEYHEAFSAITKDGLTLFISSDRPGGHGSSERGLSFMAANYDIYVTHRNSVDSSWGPVVNLGPNINTSAGEHSPMLSPDGHDLYFMSERPGGYGGPDIYRSFREDVTDDRGWEPPVNLGEGVNSSYVESCPVFYVADDGGSYLFYIRVEGPDPASAHVKVSELDTNTTTFMPSRAVEISTAAPDGHLDPWHGLMWRFEYPGGFGGSDLWQTERIEGVEDLTKSWTTPVNFGPDINTNYEETMPSATADGTRLYFMSDRPGGQGGMDIFEAVKEASD